MTNLEKISLIVSIFSSIATIFLTIGLVFFGALQWNAVKKQNDQNLLKMRLEHYKILKKSILEIIELAHYRNISYYFLPEQLNELYVIQYKFEDLTNEAYYLFNAKIYQYEKDLFQVLVSIINALETCQTGYGTMVHQKDNYDILKSSYKNISERFQDYLKII